MRYTELPGPLEGWTYDEHGTIYTASGYQCSARTLECALWLFQCYRSEARKYLIRSDEAPGALRPLYEVSDVTEPKRVLRVEESGKPARSMIRCQGKDVEGKRRSRASP